MVGLVVVVVSVVVSMGFEEESFLASFLVRYGFDFGTDSDYSL